MAQDGRGFFTLRAVGGKSCSPGRHAYPPAPAPAARRAPPALTLPSCAPQGPDGVLPIDWNDQLNTHVSDEVLAAAMVSLYAAARKLQ